MAAASAPVIELIDVGKAFAKPTGEPMPVLAGIDITLPEGEILGLLGRSGCGKSTLLRIAAGLVEPSAGEVRYRGRPLRGPAEGIAIVFQTFALYPWLTVLENVELGLDALDLPTAEERCRASAAIELIGLDGFESAYPRELSGGMRQRVGFARAIVADPTLLLMDEPFSALDVLTAEMLRTDFLDLWAERRLPTRAVMMVTHNIEEAVLMCDRILVLGSHPARVAAEIRVPLPQPRDRLDAQFRALVEEIYSVQTARIAEALGAPNRIHGTWAQPLPAVSAILIGDFAATLASSAYGGRAELARVVVPLALTTNDLLQIATALHILEFAEMKEGAVKLTAAGRVFAESDADERKRIFKEHLLRFVPLASHIRQVLEERDEHRAPRERFDFELQDHLSRGDADRTLQTANDWARFAELFTYDDRTRTFGVAAVAGGEAGKR